MLNEQQQTVFFPASIYSDQHWRCRAKQNSQTVAGSTSSRSDVNTKRVRITHSFHLTKFPIGITYVISIVCLYRNLFVWIQHKIKIIICLANFFVIHRKYSEFLFFFFAFSIVVVVVVNLTQTLVVCSFIFQFQEKDYPEQVTSLIVYNIVRDRQLCVLVKYNFFSHHLNRFGFQLFDLHSTEVQNFSKVQHATDWSWGNFFLLNTFSLFFEVSFLSLNLNQNVRKLPKIIEWWKKIKLIVLLWKKKL